MDGNVGGLRCDTCWGTVDALYTGRWGGWVCWLCWAKQEGDTPESRMVKPAITSAGWKESSPLEVERKLDEPKLER